MQSAFSWWYSSMVFTIEVVWKFSEHVKKMNGAKYDQGSIVYSRHCEQIFCKSAMNIIFVLMSMNTPLKEMVPSWCMEICDNYLSQGINYVWGFFLSLSLILCSMLGIHFIEFLGKVEIKLLEFQAWIRITLWIHLDENFVIFNMFSSHSMKTATKTWQNYKTLLP